MNTDKAINDYVECYNYLANVCPDPETLPYDKQYFYKKVLAMLDASQVLIKAQAEKINWLEASAVKNKTADEKIRRQQVQNIIALARARGVDVDLLRYLD